MVTVRAAAAGCGSGAAASEAGTDAPDAAEDAEQTRGEAGDMAEERRMTTSLQTHRRTRLLRRPGWRGDAAAEPRHHHHRPHCSQMAREDRQTPAPRMRSGSAGRRAHNAYSKASAHDTPGWLFPVLHTALTGRVHHAGGWGVTGSLKARRRRERAQAGAAQRWWWWQRRERTTLAGRTADDAPEAG